MCGIVGLFLPAGLDSPDETGHALGRAADAVAYRGPDAHGVTVWPRDGIGFAHRRLSILDLDPRSNQPMTSADGTVLITYNGEIYNFRELKAALAAGGCEFRTESDTEVLVEGYRHWGIDGLLARVVGMFAFGLYDREARTLFVVRDRAGQKPAFYTLTGGGAAFASEIRSLLALCPAARALDPKGLDAYLTLKLTPSPLTLYRGVSKVPPGHYVEISATGSATLHRYWDPLDGTAAGTDAAGSIAAISERLVRSVERRLLSDVPVCMFLSGGIDSSLIADAFGQIGRGRMRAYSIGYADLPAYNEFEYARKVAASLPIDYEEIVLESADARRLLDDDALVLDEPLSDWTWVPLHEMSRRAAGDGFKVALLGEGADELFFGYNSMLKGLRRLERYRSPLRRAAAVAGAKALRPLYARATRGHTRYDLMRRVAEGEPVYLGGSIGFGRSQRHQVAGPRLLAEGDAGAGAEAVAALHARYDAGAADRHDDVNRICYVEFMTRMTEVLLQRVDRVTMASSLEARSPYLDHELVASAFSVAGELKIRGGLKGFFKEYARARLPADVVDRRKMGFSFPFEQWLRGDLGAVVEETFAGASLFRDGWLDGEFAQRLVREHRRGAADHAPRTWTLFSLCRWYERWLAGAA